MFLRTELPVLSLKGHILGGKLKWPKVKQAEWSRRILYRGICVKSLLALRNKSDGSLIPIPRCKTCGKGRLSNRIKMMMSWITWIIYIFNNVQLKFISELPAKKEQEACKRWVPQWDPVSRDTAGMPSACNQTASSAAQGSGPNPPKVIIYVYAILWWSPHDT